MECFEKMEYPLPPQAAAAFVASTGESERREGEGSEGMQHAQEELRAATAAAASGGSNGPVESAFAEPSVQSQGRGNVAQARQLLGKVRIAL